MKTWEMEKMVMDLVKRFNLLINKSGYLSLIKNLNNGDYELRGSIPDGNGKNCSEEIVIKATPYLSELEGFVEGMILCNDFGYFGQDTKNPFYRYTPRPMKDNSASHICDIALQA